MISAFPADPVIVPEPIPPTAADFLANVRAKLTAAFAPLLLEIRDESARHAGHREAAGRFHLHVQIVSEHFAGLGPLARHRRVQQVLASELAGPLHALGIDARAPEEARELLPSGGPERG